MKATNYAFALCCRLAGDESNAFIEKMSPDPVKIGQLVQRCPVKRLLISPSSVRHG